MTTTTKTQQINQITELNYPASPFTFSQLEDANTMVSVQTLRLRLKKLLDSGEVVKSDELLNTGKKGRPQCLYNLV